MRVHLQNTFSDLLGSERSLERSLSLPKAMQRIADEGGVLVVLGNQETNEDIITKVKQFEAEDKGELPTAAKWQGTSRTVGIGCQILASSGLEKCAY